MLFLAVCGSGEDAYYGPSAWGGIARRNVIHNNGWLRVSGPVRDVVFEKCAVRNADCGILVNSGVRRGSPEEIEKGKPSGILVRNCKFENVKKLSRGSGMDRVEFVPPVQQ